jgi:hypothetical protein
MYIFHTEPMAHQSEFFRLYRDAEFFANLSEQGTGKTKSIIDIAGDKFERNLIDGLFIAAPNEGDIPENWLDQIVIHLPPRIPRSCVRYRGSGYMRVGDRKMMEAIVKGTHSQRALRVISTNIEAIRKGSPIFTFLLDWMRKFRVMFVIDEATRISTPGASQTKGALKLGANAAVRAISTGTLTAGGPFNAYAPMEFLSPDILDCPSFTAFKAEYCKMLPPEHGLVRHIIRQGARSEAHAEKLKSIIQLPERDAAGRPIYKNLDQLQKIIAKVSYRRLKADCLDLPPKVYQRLYTDMTEKQKEIYEQVRTEVVAEFVHEKRVVQMTIDMAMKRLLRLQQIVGNYYSPDPDPDEPRSPPKRIEAPEDNPKIKVLEGIIQDADPSARGIVWCRFTPEINEIVGYLREKYGASAVVEYHGKQSSAQQVMARKSFLDLNSPVRWLIGQIKAGIGVDMYTASWEYFYSNDYSLENRLQAEDRAHRKGLSNSLTIFDSETRGSIESRIISTLRSKKEVSEMILGDPPQNWI